MSTVKYLVQNFANMLNPSLKPEAVQSKELPIFFSGFSICIIPDDNVMYLSTIAERDRFHLV